ncbi:E3 ubiquitin-protein ligase PHF7 isoform X1 [Sminthopsis crassicaudata]|uniref:E3 ubiquitin-protein ligase PHF7 isoform X1 n=2 Tax=Sminthopsis crassicaudata TaxID=9301 RepID=UPI003D689CC3
MRIVNRKGKTKGLRDSIMSWWTAQMQQSSGPVCRMCLQEPGDPEKLGEFLQRDNLRIHYFCLYICSMAPQILSSGLPQRGRASDGFHGFLPEDIKKETSRAARKTCFVCKKKGAAIFCQKERCRRNFHLPCGRERGCISQFFGEYKSFCEKHRPTQDIQPEKRAEEDCILCCESLSGGNDDNIQSPCCSRMIYHRKCIQKYAHSSAKHFFKCPQCNNREEFPKEMLRMGIHIPDRDAAWELEPGAFSELYQRHHHCDAPICLYKDGRDNFENEGRWSLILCTTCGSQGTHRNCSSLRSNSKKWECAECMSTGEIPGCSKTLSPRKDFYRGTGQNGSQEEDPGPSLRERPGPSFLQESSELSSPEKTEPSCWERRRSTWRAKRLKISKHRKKKE